MEKKAVKKKTSASKKKVAKKKPKKITKAITIPKEDAKLGKILIENFVGLQKVMVNLSTKFEDLSTQISKLLELFEISAKALAEKDLTIEQNARDDTKILEQINDISNQNKIIARGLTLMHKRLSGEPEEPVEKPFSTPPFSSTPPQNFAPKLTKQPTQPLPNANPGEKVIDNKDTAGYQKSIASEPTNKYEQ